MSPPIKIAAVQLCTGTEVADNNRQIEQAIREAASQGAQLVCLPEAANLLLRDIKAYPAACVTEAQDTTLSLCRSLTRELGIWLHTGSLLLRTEEGDRIWNRSHLLTPTGEIAARYDKLHTFDVRLGGSGDFQESASVRPGEGGPVVVHIAPLGITLGMAICYDVRFGHLFRALAQAGADVLLVPASFSVITGPHHWEVLLRARAIETGSYVIAAAQCGERDGLRVYGHSCVIEPFGELLAQADDVPAILYAQIDPAQAQETRQRLPCLQQARELPPPHRITAG